MDRKAALVLGATGGIGGAVARRLASGGWRVRGLARRPAPLNQQDGIDWMQGDAMSVTNVREAAEGASLIVHAVNPPGYRHWEKLVLPMLDNTIAAAGAVGARIILPGTIYNYGPDALPAIDETSPQHPLTVKGRLRVEMEQRLQRAAGADGVRVLVVRAGDFFGPQAGNNWFGQGLVKPGTLPRSITYPGKPGIGHQWAYLPDVAETMVRLAERNDLDRFATFHMEGHWDADGRRMIEAIRRALANPTLPVRRMPWWLIRLLSPVVPLFREVAEMKYLWDQPIRMNNARLRAALGEEPHTPLDQAVRTTLIGLGCMPMPPAH